MNGCKDSNGVGIRTAVTNEDIKRRTEAEMNGQYFSNYGARARRAYHYNSEAILYAIKRTFLPYHKVWRKSIKNPI